MTSLPSPHFAAALVALLVVSPIRADELENPPFAAIHTAYQERDEVTHTRLLRGALREARRLLPEACLQRQRELVEVAKIRGFDGLESLWLIYQDCAAQEKGPALVAAREENLRALREMLRYADEPAPQLPLRVSHWNSVYERGVRGEAVRTLLGRYAAAEPAVAQAWSLRDLLRQSQVTTALCALPLRVDQSGRHPVAELLRYAQCQTGAVGPSEVCAKLALGQGSGRAGSLPALSQEDTDVLADLCNNLAGSGGAAGAGIDSLDGFSADQCASEDETHLYETEEVMQLIEDCYSGGGGNPFALGPADVGIEVNQVIEWENAGTFNAFLTVGTKGMPDRDHFHGTGNSAQEARDNLEVLGKDSEGNSIVDEKQWTEERDDGTFVQVEQTVKLTPDGGVIIETNRTYPDGSSYSETTTHHKDGSTETKSVAVGEDGSTSTTESKTDKDGTTTFKTVNRDKDGNLVSEGEGTIGPAPKDPTDDHQFDPHNPACQELATIGILPSSNRNQFWDQLYQRGSHVDPRTIYPNPETAGSEEEPLCGATGLGNTSTPATCSTPVMCMEGTELDERCQCSRPLHGVIALRGCFAATCPADTYPTPVGMNACKCEQGDPPDGGGPSPLPDPAGRARLFFSELVWNRGDDTIFATEEMATGGQLPR